MTTPADGHGPPQVWHRYRMSHSLNVAWLGRHISTAQILALEDAWDLLVVHDDWRDWVGAYLVPPSPFLYVAVRDDLPKRRLLKASKGVSLHLPASEVTQAQERGELVGLYLGVIRDVYDKWAGVSDCPSPPPLPASD